MTKKEQIKDDDKIYEVTFWHTDSAFTPDPSSVTKEELRIESNGMIHYTAQKVCMIEEILRCSFMTRPETVEKLFDRIDEIRKSGMMESDYEYYVCDGDTFSIAVNYNGLEIETDSSIGFPMWSIPILRSLRMIIINYGQGLRPGMLFNVYA